MKVQRILQSGFGLRLLGALLFGGMGAALERAGWKGSAILSLVVVGSVVLGVSRLIYTAPLTPPKARGVGAGGQSGLA